MTDEQLHAQDWLNRMYHFENKLAANVRSRDKVLASLSGIGKYDAEFIPTQTGENSTETKLLEFSRLSEIIEKDVIVLLHEDNRTREVIEKIGDTPDDEIMKAVLIDRYVNRLKWEDVGRLHNYSIHRTKQLHGDALKKIVPFIPQGETLDEIRRN